MSELISTICNLEEVIWNSGYSDYVSMVVKFLGIFQSFGRGRGKKVVFTRAGRDLVHLWLKLCEKVSGGTILHFFQYGPDLKQ